jgi:hypothetical protein
MRAMPMKKTPHVTVRVFFKVPLKLPLRLAE